MRHGSKEEKEEGKEEIVLKSGAVFNKRRPFSLYNLIKYKESKNG